MISYEYRRKNFMKNFLFSAALCAFAVLVGCIMGYTAYPIGGVLLAAIPTLIISYFYPVSFPHFKKMSGREKYTALFVQQTAIVSGYLGVSMYIINDPMSLYMLLSFGCCLFLLYCFATDPAPY